MKVLTITSVILLAALLTFAGCDRTIPPGHVEWTDFSTIQSTFPRTGVDLFVYVKKSHCEWCEQMDSTVFNRPEIADHLNKNYMCVSINVDEDMPITINNKEYNYNQFFDLLHLREIPAYLFFDAQGKPIGILNSAMEVKTFKQFLIYVKNRHFFRTRWEDFMKLPEADVDTVWGKF